MTPSVCTGPLTPPSQASPGLGSNPFNSRDHRSDDRMGTALWRGHPDGKGTGGGQDAPSLPSPLTISDTLECCKIPWWFCAKNPPAEGLRVWGCRDFVTAAKRTTSHLPV